MNYSEAIKTLRHRLILSQTEFAEFLGVSFANYEKNRKIVWPQYDKNRVICKKRNRRMGLLGQRSVVGFLVCFTNFKD